MKEQEEKKSNTASTSKNKNQKAGTTRLSAVSLRDKLQIKVISAWFIKKKKAWQTEQEKLWVHHRLVRKKLSGKDYARYLLQEFLQKEWKHYLPVLLLIVLILIVLMSIGHGISSLMQPKTAVETETETESETSPVYEETDITIGSTGCMLLHSPFIDSYPDAEGNYDFSSIYEYITPYYSAPDFMTCEFEGALGGSGYSGYPLFISPDIIIENIRDSGVDLQFLATNHIYDGGSDAFHRTMEIYEEKGIDYSGIRESETDKPYTIVSIGGVEVGFIDYVYETTGYGTNLNGIQLEEQDWELVNTFDYEDLDSFYAEIQDNITAMQQDGARFIIAQMHWGTEYQLEESDYQDAIAQELCDLGVDAIIGGHPHCEQPIDVLERSDGSAYMFCIYSEGNALSNQRTYLMDEMPTGHTEDGAMITLTLHQDTDGTVRITDVDLLPTWVYRYQENGSKYYILPLDDVDQLENVTGISGIEEEAQDSYDRTMEELGPGLQKAKEIFAGSTGEQGTAQGDIGLGVS